MRQKAEREKAQASFDALDTNQDDGLDEKEYNRGRKAGDPTFAEVDTNGDGKIDREEYVKAKVQAIEPTFDDLDTNHDDGLTKEEYNKGRKGGDLSFAEADTNGDGKIDREEYERAKGPTRNPARPSVPLVQCDYPAAPRRCAFLLPWHQPY